jgi:hypothetical protein
MKKAISVAHQPAGKRDRQAPVRRPHDEQHADEVDGDVVGHVEHLDHAFAHGERGLHKLGGDPAGKLVLVEGHRLLEQIAMDLPADAHRIVAEQRLLLEQRMGQHHQRQADKDDEGHACKAPAFLLKEGRAVALGQPVDDVAEEGEHPHLGHRDQRHQDGGRDQIWPGPLGVVQAEGHQRARRFLRFLGGERVESLFKPAKHASSSSSIGRAAISGRMCVAAPCWRRDPACLPLHQGLSRESVATALSGMTNRAPQSRPSAGGAEVRCAAAVRA